MSDTARDADAIAVITVHGTGDTAAGPDGEKWFQNGSAFVSRLRQGLASRGLQAEIVPHLWSGANSATEREKGAEKLAKLIRKLSRNRRSVHVIGHSHGGNVANDAACMIGWSSKQHRPKIASVTTVGAPFFRTHVTNGERLGAWAFIVMTIVSMLVLVPSALGVVGLTSLLASEVEMVATENLQTTREAAAAADREAAMAAKERTALPSESGLSPEIPQDLQEKAVAAYQQKAAAAQVEADRARMAEVNTTVTAIVGAILIASAVTLFFVVPLAFRGINRIRRAGRKARSDTFLFSIWHPNDEAISFLKRVESFPLEPFPRWSLLRGSRTGAISLGMGIVVFIPLLGFLLLAIEWVLDAIGYAGFLDLDIIGAILLAVGLVGGPLIFAGVYIVYRMFFAPVEFWGRDPLNRSIGGVLKGIAFGRDGDHRICDVAPCSHYYAVKQAVLEGDLAKRMLDASTEATRKLFDRYRGSLFAVGADNPNAVNQLATDAMTWDSLIHTTYFEQPEIADMIAAHIAESTVSKAPARQSRKAEAPMPAPALAATAWV